MNIFLLGVGKMGEGSQKVRTSLHSKFGDVMHSTVTLPILYYTFESC